MELERLFASRGRALQHWVIALITIALAGCGGSGFYGSNASSAASTSGSISSSTSSSSSSNSTTSTTPQLNMSASKPSMLVSGDTDVITVTLISAGNQPLSGQTINFSIFDTQDNQVTVTSSSPITNSQGQATFTISMPAETGTVAQNLKNSGLLLTATYTSPTTNQTVTQSLTINVVTSVAVIAISSHLNITSDHASLQPTGDQSLIHVQVMDADNHGISDQNVVLSIPNAASMGMYINGAAQAATDASGTATFAVVQSGNPVSDLARLAQGVQVQAATTVSAPVGTSAESTDLTAHQTTTLNMSQP